MDTTMPGNSQDATVCDRSLFAHSRRIRRRAISATSKLDWFELELKKLSFVLWRLPNPKTLTESSQWDRDNVLDATDGMLIELIGRCHVIGCTSDVHFL